LYGKWFVMKLVEPFCSRLEACSTSEPCNFNK
jgi:hypothetical protein